MVLAKIDYFSLSQTKIVSAHSFSKITGRAGVHWQVGQNEFTKYLFGRHAYVLYSDLNFRESTAPCRPSITTTNVSRNPDCARSRLRHPCRVPHHIED
jgi:hypothetical protein